ncbi:MAG TPA: TonB-dependent receptor, partial [Steroidobacteraceae bacterium]|nr:TonB-dependent receptor [Steroidobacteraceae bacterium]
MKTTVNKKVRDSRGGHSQAVVVMTCAAAVAMLLSAAARAQDAPADQSAAAPSSAELQEVVVTAERRSNNIQQVPIAVSAFTADQLQSRQLNDIHALGNLTPGVNLDAGAPFSGDRSVLSASIRGIGQDDFAFNLNPGVGVYLDGVFLARTIGANQNLLDVDRVEILKGPQGTLFGANTIGGAISIVTHTPGNDPRFVAQVTGGQYNRRDVSFTADLPIIKDVLLTSISVSSQNQTGWDKVIPYPANSLYGSAPFVTDPQTSMAKAGYETNDNYDGTGVVTMRGKVLWMPSDKLKMTFTGDWSHEDQTALGYRILNTYTGNMNYSAFSTLYNLCISNGASGIAGAIGAAGGPPDFVVAGALANQAPFNAAPVPNFALGCTSPRARNVSLNAIGGAPLIGAGYVGVPVGTIPFPGVDPRYNYGLYLNPATRSQYLGSQQPRIFDQLAASQTGNIDTSYASGPDFARNDVFGFSAQAEYSLTDDITLKSITAYRQIAWRIGTDLDGTPETLQEVSDAQHQYQVSQEFQINGTALEKKLNYVGGLYYFKEAGYVHDYVPFESLLYVYDVANDVENKNYAAFVHADYRLNDQWGFTAGGRYTSAQAYFLGGQSDLNDFPFLVLPGGVQLPASTLFRYFPPIPDSQAWHIFDPTVGVQFHFNNDVMAYASWGKGFKAGGWTTRLSAPISSPKQAEFSPEYSKTWELGLKADWLNHRLRTNAAVFYTDYDGIQLNIQQGISPVYTNAGNAKIKGAELEMQALVGGGLQFNASASYIDAYYVSVNQFANIPQSINNLGATFCPVTVGPVNPVTGLVTGVCNFNSGGKQTDAKLPKTPKYKFTIDPEYDISLTNQAQLRLITAFTYTAELWNDALNTPELRRPATRALDASLHYTAADESYDVAVGGSNLTNDRYPTAGSPNTGAGEVGAYFNPP